MRLVGSFEGRQKPFEFRQWRFCFLHWLAFQRGRIRRRNKRQNLNRDRAVGVANVFRDGFVIAPIRAAGALHVYRERNVENVPANFLITQKEIIPRAAAQEVAGSVSDIVQDEPDKMRFIGSGELVQGCGGDLARYVHVFDACC